MQIKCAYYYLKSYNINKCLVENQEIPSGTTLEFIVNEGKEKNSIDMKFIHFHNCRIPTIPQGLTKIFPNLKIMQINNSELKEISRADLFEYRHFKRFYFHNNQIDFLPGDLFADCKDLALITFTNNPLTIIEPNILDGLKNLKYVHLNGTNIKYGLIDSDTAISHSDPQFLDMKNKLYVEYMKPENVKLREGLEPSLMSDFKTFIQFDETFKDFQINIGDRQFHVHKFLLAARSPTLAEILRNNPEAEDLNLVDISVDIFEDILKFIYSDKFPVNNNFMQLFAAAGRLQIEKLMNYAAKKVLEQLTAENALEVLNLGIKFGHDEMKQKAFEEIKWKYPKIEFEDEWINEEGKIEKVVEYFLKIRAIEKEFVDIMKK